MQIKKIGNEYIKFLPDGSRSKGFKLKSQAIAAPTYKDSQFKKKSEDPNSPENKSKNSF